MGLPIALIRALFRAAQEYGADDTVDLDSSHGLIEDMAADDDELEDLEEEEAT